MQSFASDTAYLIIYLFWFFNSLSFLLIGMFVDNKLFTLAGSSLIIWLTIFTSILAVFLLYNFKVSDSMMTNGNWLIISDFHTRVQMMQTVMFLLILVSLSSSAISGGKELHMDALFLFLISHVFMVILVSLCDLLYLYVVLELQSLSFYCLCAWSKDSLFSLEASLKYFFLGCMASGVMLIGMSMMYFNYGSTCLLKANVLYTQLEGAWMGIFFLLIGMLFKLGVAPFHQWAMDVYEGSPSVVTQMLAIMPKISTSMVIWNILTFFSFNGSQSISGLLLSLAFFSVFIGGLWGVSQMKLKSLIGYSGLFQLGFMLISLASFSILGLSSWMVFILSYSLVSFMQWSLMLMSKGNKSFYLEDLKGFMQHSPAQGLSWAMLLLCSAGLPPFFHFVCKLSMLLVLVKQGLMALALLVFLLSALTCLYYLSAIAFIFFSSSQGYFFQSVYGCLQILETVSPVMTFMQGGLLYLVTFLLMNPSFMVSWVHYSTLVFFL